MASAKEVTDRALEAWNAKHDDAFAACYSDDAEIVGPGMQLRGQEGARQFLSVWTQAMPDNDITVINEYVTGSAVVQEAIFSGTHTGDLVAPDGQVIPPTGQRVSARYADVFVIDEGLIQSEHLYWDQVEILSQLGLMPAPAAS